MTKRDPKELTEKGFQAFRAWFDSESAESAGGSTK